MIYQRAILRRFFDYTHQTTREEQVLLSSQLQGIYARAEAGVVKLVTARWRVLLCSVSFRLTKNTIPNNTNSTFKASRTRARGSVLRRITDNAFAYRHK